MGRFSGTEYRIKNLMSDLVICQVMGWTLSDVKKLTVFERDSVIRYLKRKK
jgi:hypothetical protein